MDKDEFLGILRSQLSGQMSEQQIATHIQYYRSYIEERIAAGSSESEVMRELGDPRLIARTLLDTENGENTSQNFNSSGSETKYGNLADSDRKQHKFKLDLTTWYGKLIVVLIAALVLVVLFILLGILIPIMVVAGVIIYLVRFRRK